MNESVNVMFTFFFLHETISGLGRSTLHMSLELVYCEVGISVHVTDVFLDPCSDEKVSVYVNINFLSSNFSGEAKLSSIKSYKYSKCSEEIWNYLYTKII